MRFRSNFHQIKVRLLGNAEGVIGTDDAYLLAIGSDQAHLRDSDSLVDSRLDADEHPSFFSRLPWVTDTQKKSPHICGHVR
jgi:hypothetical protein